MNYLFENVSAVTMDEDKPLIEDAYVAVTGGKISHVGGDKPAFTAGYEKINGRGKVLMPGLINAHTHMPMTLMRGYADDYGLQTWLNEYIFPAEAKLDGRSVKAGTLLGMAEAIMSGTTSFSDTYYFCDEIIECVVESGMKANISRSLVSTGEESDFKAHTGFKEMRALVERWQGEDAGRIIIEAGIHAEYTSHPRLWRSAADYAAENGLGMHVHLSETESEHAACIEKYGKTPAEILGENGVWDVRALAAHGVWLSDGDMELLSRKGVVVVHNPISNGKLGSGVCRVPELMKAGVNLALGTDSVSSNNSHDMFEEMKTAVIMQRGARRDVQALKKRDVLRMATLGGAGAQGRKAQCGCIRTGMDADLILLGFEKPGLIPCHDILSSLVFSASGSDVCLNMVRGKILYRDGDFLTLDIEKIVSEVRDYAVPRIFGKRSN